MPDYCAAGPDSPSPTAGISVVVPCYRSQETVPQLVEELAGVLPALAGAYEVILVNDGSPDGTWEAIRRASTKFPFVVAINLMRNFGQHNAVLCGVRRARYDVTITMDDDLQHPPSEIHRLLAKLREGYDVVYGAPETMAHSLRRSVMSRFYKWAMAFAMGAQTARNISAFRAIRTDLRKAFDAFASPHLLFDVLLTWGTTRFSAVKVRHEPRRVGQTNYTVRKLVNQAMLMLTGYTTAPLRMASIMGLLCTLLGVGVFGYVMFLTVVLRVKMQTGFPFLAATISIFGGAQLFCLGIVGEYLARMFNRSMDRPTYVIKEEIADAPTRPS